MTIPYDYLWNQVNEVLKSRTHIDWALVQSMREEVRYVLTLGPVVGENMRLFVTGPDDTKPGYVEISLGVGPEYFKLTQEYFAAHPGIESLPAFTKHSGGLYISPTDPHATGPDSWRQGGYIYFAANFREPNSDRLFNIMAIWLIDNLECILLLREKIAEWHETRNCTLYDYLWKQVSRVLKSRPYLDWELVPTDQEELNYLIEHGPFASIVRLMVTGPDDVKTGLVEISFIVSPRNFKITQEYFAAHPGIESDPAFTKHSGGLLISPTDPHATGPDSWRDGGYIYFAAHYREPNSKALFDRIAIWLIDNLECILILQGKIAEWQETRN